MHCFWEKFGWCKGMLFEFEATNNNCQFPCLIVYDDGEEEKVDLLDDTVKVFDGMHECAGDLLWITLCCDVCQQKVDLTDVIN